MAALIPSLMILLEGMYVQRAYSSLAAEDIITPESALCQQVRDSFYLRTSRYRQVITAADKDDHCLALLLMTVTSPGKICEASSCLP